jgi:hypothetical protein
LAFYKAKISAVKIYNTVVLVTFEIEFKLAEKEATRFSNGRYTMDLTLSHF